MRHRELSIWVLLAALLLPTGTALAKEKVKVAFIGPLTGALAVNGVGGRNSADLAIKMRNGDAKAKYTYEMVALDDECKPNIGVQAATKASADNGIIAAVPHYCSAVAVATVDTYHKFGLPVVVWGAVHPDITYGHNYREIHRVNGTMINQNEVAAKFVKNLGYKTWAIIHDTTDYGKGHNKYFSEYIKAAGGQILITIGVSVEQQDFTAELTQIKGVNPEVLYFGGNTPIGVRIRLQMDKLGITALFQGTSGIVSAAFIAGTADLAEGCLAFLEGAPAEKLPGGKFFIEKYTAAGYKEAAEAYGPFAFAAMNLIMDAIEAVGPDRDKVKAYLNKVKDVDTIVGKVSFDDHGQNIVPLITKYVIQDKKFVPWEDSEYATGKRKLARQP